MPRQVPDYLAFFLAVILSSPALGAEDGSKAVTIAPAASKDAAPPEATTGDVTVSWKGGQLLFPDAGGKTSGLRVRCMGSVTIEGKGITARAANLDVTIDAKEATATAANLSLRCTGDVTIEWKGFTARAADLQYHAEKNLLTLSSGGRPSGCTFRSKNADGTCSLLIAQQISLSPFSSKVNCVGVTEYKAAAGPTDSAYPYQPVVPPAGPYPSVAPAPGPAITY